MTRHYRSQPARRQRSGSGHSVRLSATAYARVILAAEADRQDINEWAEAAVVSALELHDQRQRYAAYVAASREAEEKRRPSPLLSDYIGRPKKAK